MVAEAVRVACVAVRRVAVKCSLAVVTRVTASAAKRVAVSTDAARSGSVRYAYLGLGDRGL